MSMENAGAGPNIEQAMTGETAEFFGAIQGFYTKYDGLFAVADMYRVERPLSNADPDTATEAVLALSYESQVVSEHLFSAVNAIIRTDLPNSDKADMVTTLFMYGANKLILDKPRRQAAHEHEQRLMNPDAVLDPEDIKDKAKLTKLRQEVVEYYEGRLSKAGKGFAKEAAQDMAKLIWLELATCFDINIDTTPDLPTQKANIAQKVGRTVGNIGILGFGLALMAQDKSTKLATSFIKRAL
ncbi:MAG: hypothetical protein WC498_00200 [Candidatus Saccharimonadales bacterium]